MPIGARECRVQRESYGGWVEQWEREINGSRYRFVRAYIKGARPVVHMSAYRNRPGTVTWVETHRFRLSK